MYIFINHIYIYTQLYAALKMRKLLFTYMYTKYTIFTQQKRNDKITKKTKKIEFSPHHYVQYLGVQIIILSFFFVLLYRHKILYTKFTPGLCILYYRVIRFIMATRNISAYCWPLKNNPRCTI